MDFSDDDNDDDMDILEIIEFGFPRKIYVRNNYFESMDNLSFYQRFRFDKDSVLYILNMIEDTLEYPDDRNNSVSPINQLLIALRFYASNGHLNSIADFAGVHLATVSRIIVRVSESLAHLSRQFIKMPETDREIRATINEFADINGFPKVIGALDGTHIKVQNPGGEDGEIFRNRKRYFSINVQVVGGPDLKIQDVVCRWPGSSHDATIFNNSRICARFERGDVRNVVLLGDSGYPLKRYLLTPVLNPITAAEVRYNHCHIRTRNSVERLFGNWKRRFPVLAYGCRLQIETVQTVVVACAVLQNIAILLNQVELPPPEDMDPEELHNAIDMGQIDDDINHVHIDGLEVINRQNIIHNYFNNA